MHNFFLVIVIIFICSHSSKFTNLLGKRNPVATLATLILLSYTKLLETVIATFSFIPLNYPNGTLVIKWRPDPSIAYTDVNHIILVCAAIFILFVGLLYTILLFSWQWLLHSPRKKAFQWTRNQKLHSFIDTYHTPHNAKYRYWTGLLLLVRIIVYLISAFSVSIDPRITLLATIIVACLLLLFKTLLINRVFKNRLLNIMESFVYFNIATFTSFTWYTFDDSGSKSKEIFQAVVAYLSVGSILILLLFVIIFHVYRYGNAKIYSFGQSTKIGKKMKKRMSHNQDEVRWIPTDSNVYNLFDVIDSPRDSSGYIPPAPRLREGITSSVVYMNSSSDESESLESPVTQSIELEDQTNQHFHARGNINNSKQKGPQAEAQAPKEITQFQLSRKTTERSFSFSFSDDSIQMPLLTEDKL